MVYQKKYDWESIKLEYIVGELVTDEYGNETRKPYSTRRLAEKHEIPFSTLKQVCHKEKWVLEEQIDDMLRSVKEILDPKEHILLTNVYSLGFSTLVVENLMKGIFNVPDQAESGEIFLNDEYDKKLPLGVFYRYLYQS